MIAALTRAKCAARCERASESATAALGVFGAPGKGPKPVTRIFGRLMKFM
jgi:hypothetical protein